MTIIKQKKFTKLFILIFTLICSMVVTILTFSFTDPPFYINWTDSMPKGIYKRVREENFKIGDYVIFHPPFDVAYLPAGHYFLKIIGGTEGSRYWVKNNIFYIDGRNYGYVYQKDTQGKALRQIEHDRIMSVKKGSFIPVTASERSYDGRYYGEIPISSIKYKVVPLFTY